MRILILPSKIWAKSAHHTWQNTVTIHALERRAGDREYLLEADCRWKASEMGLKGERISHRKHERISAPGGKNFFFPFKSNSICEFSKIISIQ